MAVCKMLPLQTRGPEVSVSRTHIRKPGAVAQIYNPSVGEVEIGESMRLARQPNH